MTSTPAIELLKATPGLAIRPDPDGLRATLVAAEGLDEVLVAEAAAALKSDVQTRDSVVKGIQRWRSIMAQLRAEHGRFIKEGGIHGGPFLPPDWYVAMHEDLIAVDALLRDRFCVDFCLSGPVDDPDAPLGRVDCKEPAPDGRFDSRLACEYCNQEYYEDLYRQCIGEYQEHGLAPPDAVLAATEAYRTEQDALAEFLDDCCLIKPDAWCSSSAAWTAYEAYLGKSARLTRTEFSRAMTARGFNQVRGRVDGRQQRGYKGVGLVSLRLTDTPEIMTDQQWDDVQDALSMEGL